MKTLKLTEAWILICSITAVSTATTEHALPHHNVSQHGGNTPQKTHPNTIVPFGIQIPEHVLSTKDVACISADNNIFQIVDEAKKSCNGTDMRCTFYHFVNHGYQNIGALDINKELFDDLLMKFDNWLLTAENIDKAHVHRKVNANSSLDSVNSVHDEYNNESKVDNASVTIETSSVNKNQGNFDYNDSESDNDRAHNHYIKNPDAMHHKNHHHKLKHEDHVILDTDYKNGHRYFEVFLPKDRRTGKSRTIYVEIDKDKNEFVLVDEDINKKLNGVKPIKIELDELSEIADSAFNNFVKSLKHKGHIYNNLNDDKVMTSNLNTNSAVHNNKINLDINVDEPAPNILNFVCDPKICDINANQQLIPNNTTGNVKNILNVDKNLIVLNKYINQEQYQVESQINNTTEDALNNHFEILQNINETDINQTDFYEKEQFDTIEFDHNNITNLDIDNVSQEFIPSENEYYNNTEIHDFSSDHENVTYDDNDYIQVEENNDISNYIDIDDAHDLSSSKTIDVDKPQKFIPIPSENEYDNNTEINDFSSDHENVTYDDNDYIQVEENNDTSNDIDIDDAHDLSSSKTIDVDKPQKFIPIPSENVYDNNTEINDFSSDHENVTYDDNDYIQVEENNDTSNDIGFDDAHDLSSLDNPQEFMPIPSENEYDNYTESHDFSSDHENVTYDDNDYIQVVENNDTSSDIDFDDAHDLSSSNLLDGNKSLLQENKLKPTPYEPKSTSSLTDGISDYTDSQLHLIPSGNRQGQTDIHDQSSVSTKPITPFTAIPTLRKDFTKVVETDSNLQSSIPVHTTIDLLVSDSQNPLSNPDFDHSTITSLKSPLDLLRHQNTGPKIPQYTSSVFPSPVVGYAVGLNKGSQHSPLNSGLIWLPSYSGTEDPQTPCAAKPSLDSIYLPQDFISPLTQPSKVFSGSSKSISPDQSVSPDLTIPIENPYLLQSAPSFSVNIHEPYLTTKPFHLEDNTLTSPKHTVLPSKVNLPKYFADSDGMLTTSQFSEAPLLVTPYSVKGEVISPCPFQQIPPQLQPTNDNLRLVKYSIDNNLKETMIPCSPNSNRYPCNKIPYYSNPYLKPPQFIPPYFEQPLIPLQPMPSISQLNSPSISSDQSNPYLIANYPRETKPTPLPHSPCAPTTQFSPLTPLWLGPNSFPNTYPNLWNNVPYQTMPYFPCSATLNNDLASTIDLQQNQIFKPLPIKELAKSVLGQPCANKNNLQKPPLNYTPFSPVYTRPDQMELNPSLALERDLQTLSYKYGIPLAKILDSLNAEISGAHRQTCLSPSDLPCSNFLHDSSIKGKSPSSAKSAVAYDENRSGNEELLESDLNNLIPIDSTLIGPHLEIDSSFLLGPNDFQTYTIASEIAGPHNAQYLSTNSKPKNKFQDSSLIGTHLSTSKFQLSDENRIGNVGLHIQADYSNLMPLDSSLIDPHLKIGSPPMVLDSNINKGNILTSYVEVPVTSSSQVKTKINQNHLTNSLLDNSLIGPHLPTLSPAKVLLDEEIQSINEMIPLESDFTELTPIDSSRLNFVNELEQAEILQHGKITTIINSTTLYKPVETKPNLIEGELLLESDTSNLFPLDSSLIGSHLLTGSSLTNSVSLKSEESIQNTGIKVDESQSIILPSSMLPTLLNKIVKSDSNLNIYRQDTQLNEESNELSLDTNLELPITDDSTIMPSLKETDFQMVESTLETMDSTKLKPKLKSPEISSNLDTSILLDNTLIGPSLLQETDSREMLLMLDSVDNFETYKGVPTSNQNKKSSKNTAVINSKVQLDSSLSTSPNLLQEIKSQDTTVLDSVIPLDNSFAIPNLDETIELTLKPDMKTIDVSRGFDSKNILDTSLEGPHLLTALFSSDEIKMINEELQPKSEFAILKPLNASLIGSHLDFGSQLDDSEISRYQNPESPRLIEGTLKPINMPPDLQELLSKFTNAITKSHLSASEMKPCDKLLSSLAKISSDNKNIQPCEDLQTYTLINTPISLQDELASEFSPIIPTVLEQGLSPVEYITKGQPCITSNYFPTPITYAKGVPLRSFIPFSKFVQMKPLVDCNWLKPPGLRPVVGNTALSFGSNALAPLSSEDFKNLLDFAPQRKLYPQYPNIYTLGEAITPSSDWTPPSNILPIDNFRLPKKSSTILPSNVEYNPIVFDDIMSLIDEDKHKLVKDMSFLPSSAPTIPTFSSEIFSPSLLNTIPIINNDFIKSHPGLPISMTNSKVSSSLYTYPQIGLYNPPKIPFMKETSYIPPLDSQPYSNTPLEGQFSEMVGLPPKLVSLPNGSPHTLKFIEPVTNPMLDKEYTQQLLSKPCLDSPIILPSSVLDTMLQLPTASNELNNIPYQSPPVYFTPITPIPTTSLSNEFTRPLSVSYAKPIQTLSTDLAYAASVLAPPKLSINPYTNSPCIPDFSSLLMPLKVEPSDYSYLPTENRPKPSTVPYKPSQTYSSSYLPVHPSLLPTDSSPYSPAFIGKLAPYFRPVSKSLTNIGFPAYSDPLVPVSPSPMAPTQPGLLSSSYVSPDSTYRYSPLPAKFTNPLKRPSGVLSPAFLTPISQDNSDLPSNIRYLTSNLISNLNSQTKNQELQLMKPINALPISFVNSTFANANQMLPISPNIPIPSYPSDVSKSSPYSNSQIKKNVPCEDIIQSNLQISPLTEEIPAYDVIEDNICTYSSDKDKFYQEPSLKYPLESMSYTLAPEEMTETSSDEDFVEIDHLSVGTEPSSQTKLFQRPHLTPYTPLYGKPCPAQQYLPAPSSTEPIQKNIFDYIRPVPFSTPLKYPVSLTPVSPAPNPSILSSPCIDPFVNLYNILPINKEPFFSLPYYSETGTNRLSPPADPIVLRNIISPASFQIPRKSHFMPVSPTILPKAQPPTLPYTLDNFIELPPAYYEPKSKTRQDSLVKPTSMPSSPIISHIEAQYITPLSTPQNWTSPLFSPQYTSSILPVTTTLQKSLSLIEAPIYYQPHNPPAALPGTVKNIFKSSSVTSPFTVLPSYNNIVEPHITTDLSKPEWSSVTPQYTLPASLPSPIPISSVSVPLPNLLPVTTPQTANQASTNHIIPSSLFMSSDTNLQMPTHTLAPLNNIPKYSLPSPTYIERLETVPFETPCRLLEKTVLSQKNLKPNKHFSNDQFLVPLSPSSQPLQPIDSYPTHPSPNIQYAKKLYPKLSPVLNQYTTPLSLPSYTSLLLETVPKRLINKPTMPQLKSSDKNLFLNSNFESIPEVPSYPVPKNLISSPKIIPSDSILLSNLRPVDISHEIMNSYSSPLTPSVPSYSSSLLKPSAKSLSQKSRQYKPQIIPNYKQYVSKLPIESVSELLPSTSPLLKSPLLQPLLTASQNNVSLYPMHFSISERSPKKVLPSVTNNYGYSGPFTPLVPEIPETAESINLLPSTPYSLLKSQLNKQYQSPVSMANMPLFKSFDIVKSSTQPSIKANIVNTVKPIEVSAFTASETTPLSQYTLVSETIEEIKPFEHVNMKETFSPTNTFIPLPTYLSQQRKFQPAFSKYLTMPQALPSSPIKTRPPLSVIPENVELIDTTDFIPLSQIKSEPLIVDSTLTDRQALILKKTSSTECDISQFPPYTTLFNTPPSKYKQLKPKLHTSRYSNQIPQPSQVYLNPQEYKDLIQGPSISKGSSSSNNFLTSTDTEPQLTTSPMIETTRPVSLHTNPITFKPVNWPQSPNSAKYLNPHEIPVEITSEKGNSKTLLNKYRPYDKIAPLGINNYPLKLDNVKPNPLRKSGPNTDYEIIDTNEFNEYEVEKMAENIEARDNKPDDIDAKSFAKTVPEIFEELSVPTYNNIAQRPQRLSKLDHFYANNHIGKSPQIFTVPSYKTLPIGPPTDVRSPYTISQEIFNDFTNIPTKYFESVPKSDTLRPNEYYPEIVNSPEHVPIMNSYLQNYLNPRLKPYSQRNFLPNAIEIANTSEMPYQPTSYTPDSNVDDMKYSGYKTYRIPSFKSPKSTQNQKTATQKYDPSVETYLSPINSVKPSNVHQIPNLSNFCRPKEISEPHYSQYQNRVDMTSPLQTKLSLNNLQESPELNEYEPLIPHYQKPVEITTLLQTNLDFDSLREIPELEECNPLISQHQTLVDMTTPLQTKLGLDALKEDLEFDEYNPIENLSVCADFKNEDNELKTTLINYINKREDVKNNLYNKNPELTIPIGNIAITKKEPYNANIIETNNPSIGLKVWKSSVKIAQAELKLKFKDLSVNNFMPVINNLDKYDMEEIRKIVKNYIDGKYGAHIEVSEPYTIDNKYAIIKDFDHNAVDNKYNLLWPTNYV